MMEQATLVASPKQFVVLYNEIELTGFLWLNEYRKKYGRTKTQLLQIKRVEVLRFTDTPSPCAFRYEIDGFGNQTIAITGKGLWLLLAINILRKPELGPFDEKDIALFFDGPDLAAVRTWRRFTLPLIADLNAYATLSDNQHHYAARQERRMNWHMWKRLGVIEEDGPAPEPEPLPLKGRYSLLETVEHDRQSGLLAREMLARVKGEI